jgi:hypothetical protein
VIFVVVAAHFDVGLLPVLGGHRLLLLELLVSRV